MQHILMKSHFFQESLKWICRWCQEYCDNDGEQSEVVLAVQVYELMGLAFAYNEFVKYSFFHSKKVVSYRIVFSLTMWMKQVTKCMRCMIL